MTAETSQAVSFRWLTRFTRPAARARLVDDTIRYVGAMAVVFTVEAVCGFYLWHGSTVHVQLPDQLGWAPQFGLVGGAAVGTRAWHRGVGQSAKWGRAASLVGLTFTIVDAGIAALLRDQIINVKAGWLALGLIVQCVIIGWLAVHTLFSAVKDQETSGTPRNAEGETWGRDVELAPPEPRSIAPDMAAIEPPATGPATDPFPTSTPVAKEETVTRLRALRAANGWQSAAKERDALKVGWAPLRNARETLDKETQQP